MPRTSSTSSSSHHHLIIINHVTHGSYFKTKGLYGVACFVNMLVDNAAERGARMKSVGVICRNYEALPAHVGALQAIAAYESLYLVCVCVCVCVCMCVLMCWHDCSMFLYRYGCHEIIEFVFFLFVAM